MTCKQAEVKAINLQDKIFEKIHPQKFTVHKIDFTVRISSDVVAYLVQGNSQFTCSHWNYPGIVFIIINLFHF